MSLWTRTIMLLALAILSLSLGLGLDRAFSTEPSDLDNFVSARNTRRAIAYRFVDYRGGRVAKSDVSGVGWNPTEDATAEVHPGSAIDVRRSLLAMERHEANLAKTFVDDEKKKVRDGGPNDPGIKSLEDDIAGFNRKRREVVSELSLIENKMRIFAMTLAGYSITIKHFQQMVFNYDYEVHLAIIERDALRTELMQVKALGEDLIDEKKAIEDANYRTSSELRRTAMLIRDYEQYDPHLRGKAAKEGNPWVRGIVERASEDSRAGLIWISIGSQDGVQLGQVLSIHRGGQFVGRMRVEALDRNTAQGRLLEEFRGKVTPRAGDHVRGAPNFGSTEK
ncbi:MAG: hypothetical protein L6Q71_01435 [Planctomycetes bacterium]|nr:hypothetical protein [Planctomycetota bacterium]NUQ35935.1 hypothetical protein [Planctomycetaceae bacterium]